MSFQRHYQSDLDELLYEHSDRLRADIKQLAEQFFNALTAAESKGYQLLYRNTNLGNLKVVVCMYLAQEELSKTRQDRAYQIKSTVIPRDWRKALAAARDILASASPQRRQLRSSTSNAPLVSPVVTPSKRSAISSGSAPDARKRPRGRAAIEVGVPNAAVRSSEVNQVAQIPAQLFVTPTKAKRSSKGKGRAVDHTQEDDAAVRLLAAAQEAELHAQDRMVIDEAEALEADARRPRLAPLWDFQLDPARLFRQERESYDAWKAARQGLQEQAGADAIAHADG